MKSDKKNNRRHMHMNTYKHADTFNKKTDTNKQRQIIHNHTLWTFAK